MSLAALRADLSAAATVYDDIEDVAADVGVRSPAVARALLMQYGIASVDDDGRVTMSDRQSLRAAHHIGWAERMGA